MLNDTTNRTDPDTFPSPNGTVQSKPKSDPASVLATMAAQIAELQAQLSMAKGTADNIEAPKEPKRDLLARIEQVLRSHICTTAELAKEVGEPVSKVQEKLKVLRKNLADVGTPEEAHWFWRIGDDAPAKELKAVVARLIEGHAMTTAELTKLTGARMSRVNGVLVDLQRDPAVPIYDLGTNYRAKWLIVPKTARPANLPPKAPKK